MEAMHDFSKKNVTKSRLCMILKNVVQQNRGYWYSVNFSDTGFSLFFLYVSPVQDAVGPVKPAPHRLRG